MRKILLLFALVFLVSCVKSSSTASSGCKFIADTAIVSRVVDGDTICLQNGLYVRLIGINAPEKDELGSLSAKEKLEQLVLGKSVKLVYETERQDKYGRELADVYVNDTFVNYELASAGWVRIMMIAPNVEHTDKLRSAVSIAKNSSIGLFGNLSSVDYIMPPKKLK